MVTWECTERGYGDQGEEKHTAVVDGFFRFWITRPYGYPGWSDDRTWYLSTGAMSTIGPSMSRVPGGLPLKARDADAAKVEAVEILKQWLTAAADALV